VVALFVAVLTVFLSHVFSRRLLGPVQRLVEVCQSVARGDLSVTVSEGRDEIGILSRSFNSMARTIETLVDDVRKSAEEAKTATRAKSQFLAAMSHEILTPMNGVLGMTNLLLAAELSPKQNRRARTIRSSAPHLLSVINEVLDYSKIEAGKMTIEETRFDLVDTVEEVCLILALEAQTKGLEICCRCAPRIRGLYMGDPVHILQVITNVAGNAVKFTDRGEVAFTVDLLDDDPSQATVRISVRDTGAEPVARPSSR
jgi:two-component system sensor histidine kinase/response regulator